MLIITFTPNNIWSLNNNILYSVNFQKKKFYETHSKRWT